MSDAVGKVMAMPGAALALVGAMQHSPSAHKPEMCDGCGKKLGHGHRKGGKWLCYTCLTEQRGDD